MTQTPQDVSNIDRQIQELMECRPIPEIEIKALCDKVKIILFKKKFQ